MDAMAVLHRGRRPDRALGHMVAIHGVESELPSHHVGFTIRSAHDVTSNASSMGYVLCQRQVVLGSSPARTTRNNNI